MNRSQRLCILIVLLVGVLSFVGNLAANAAQQVSAPQAVRLSPNSISIDPVSNSTSTTATLSSSSQMSTSVPSITLSPSSASVGVTVDVSGTNFSATDSSCSVSGGAVGTPSSCVVSGGSLLGSFIIANVPVGSYTVTLTGSPVGDFASATFILSGSSSSNGPSISVNLISAAVGTGVQVSGSGFSGSDTTCSLSGTPISNPTCSMYSGGSLVGSFIVANVALGSYTITATGTQAGDHAATSFTISGGSPAITLNPTSASAGSTIQVSGSGFSLSDIGCSLTGGGAMASETCSVSGGMITASFIVANAAVGSYSIAVTGDPNNDIASAVFHLTSTTSQTTTTTTSTNQTSTSSTATNQTVTSTSTNSTSTTMAPNFSISSSISTFALSQGANRSVTITIKPMNGFNSAVTLTVSWLGSAPANITVSIGSPVAPVSNSTATSILIITAGSTASLGNFTIRVTGTSGSLTNILTPNIIVQVISTISTTTTKSTTAMSVTNSTSSTSSISSVLSSTTSLPALPANCPVSYVLSGSELAPSAQKLRLFRDQSIMKTRSGAAFMILFNAWYYSFSPHLTEYVSMHPMQRTLLKYSLYPLIAILYASYYAYLFVSPLNADAGVVTAGIVAAAMLGLVYLAPLAYLAKRAFRRYAKFASPNMMHMITWFGVSVLLTEIACFTNSQILGVATANLVLSTLTFSVLIGATAITCLQSMCANVSFPPLLVVLRHLTEVSS